MKKKNLLFLLLLMALLSWPLIWHKQTQQTLSGPALEYLTYKEVIFTNRFDSTQLAGMLFLPEQTDSFPVVVIIQGSGTSKRTNPWYLSVAQYLQQSGIGVLLPDKRGSEQSGGRWQEQPLEVLATDTESAIDYLKQESRLPISSMGIMGMSQGGWVAPIVAAHRPDIAFVIDMSGSLTTSDEQLKFEEYHNIRPYTYDFIAHWLAPLTSKLLARKPHIAALLGFDPIPYWQQIKAPVLIAFGKNDTNCPVKQSLQNIEQKSLQHFTVKVYPDGGHAIADPASNRVSADFLHDLQNFIIAADGHLDSLAMKLISIAKTINQQSIQ